MDDRQALRRDLAAALGGGDVPAAALDDVVSGHFSNLNVFRENQDLVIVGGDTRRMLVRRTGPDRFIMSDHAAASGSTNLLDAGGENEGDLDALIDAIAAFAAV